MQIRYDDDFLEGAVFRRVTNTSAPLPALQVRRFHRERERLYLIADADQRNAAFFALHLEWFREWGLEQILSRLIDELPLLESSLNTLAFLKARSKKDEGAELYVNAANERSGVVALRLERFDQAEALRTFLRHEFMHLNDMLDPRFGYSPHLQVPGQNPAQQRLTRERYRLLWDITIDGRLSRRSTPVSGADSRLHHIRQFDRAFDFWPEPKREETFSRLWDNSFPTHGELLSIASDPRGTHSADQPAPGAPCPLCGFATFSWAAEEKLVPATVARIQQEFPHWTAEQGACGRCAEIYRRAFAFATL